MSLPLTNTPLSSIDLFLSTGTLSPTACHTSELWVTALHPLSESIGLVSDNYGNLFTMAISDEGERSVLPHGGSEEARLEAIGSFHLGDQINRFESGSLNLPVRDGDDGPIITTTIFGTVSGRIGVIASISEATFKTLRSVQCMLNHSLAMLKTLDVVTLFAAVWKYQCWS